MRLNLLATAIIAGIGLSGLVVADNAFAANKTPVVTAEQVKQLQAQMAQLQAQIDALKAQTAQQQAQADAQASAQSDVNVAQAKAIEAAQAPASKVDALAKLVNNTSIGGRLYYDVSNINEKPIGGGKKVDPSGNGFDIKRFYLDVDHRFNDVWAVHLTTDFQYSSALNSSELYLKKAYVEGKFDKLFALRAGADDQPWIPFVEGLYGNRYVDKTITDMTGMATSADWGVHAMGANSLLNYAVSVTNGNGYKATPDNGINNRSKSMDVEGRVDFTPIEGLNLALGGYRGKKGKNTYANEALTNEGTYVLKTANRLDALIVYANSDFRVGGEYFVAKNYSNPLMTAGATNVKWSGYSLFGSINLTDSGINVFARYDQTKTDKDDANHDGIDPKFTYWDLGIEFPLAKGVKISPAFKYVKNESGSAINSMYLGGYETKEFGVWGEFRF